MRTLEVAWRFSGSRGKRWLGDGRKLPTKWQTADQSEAIFEAEAQKLLRCTRNPFVLVALDATCQPKKPPADRFAAGLIQGMVI